MGTILTPKTIMIAGGLLTGGLAVLLTRWGNPPNMGFCFACFLRDISGSLGFHRAELVQYLRPEVLGVGLGAFLSARLAGEFRPRGGSSPIIRFFLGLFMMVGALVFLGCPIRAALRIAGGDLNALVGLAGLVSGVVLGIFFLKRGFNLGRAAAVTDLSGIILPLALVGLLALSIAKPVFILASQKGPGSQFAPYLLSLFAGLAIGVLAQRTRICFTGAWRDVFLVRDYHLLSGVVSFIAGALVMNYALGNFSSGALHWGFTAQPIAHDNHLWNFLGLALVGLAGTLLGGCPLRQTILSAEGNTDSAFVVLGLLAGAALSHNFLLASSPKGPGLYGPAAVLIGLSFCLAVGFLQPERKAQR